MKPQNSEITTSPRDQHSSIGMQRGERGLATPASGNQSAPTIPARSYAQSLEPQDRFKHRAFIAFRIEALLDGYWNNRPEDAVREMILADWMEALEDFAPEEIDAACKAYLRGADRGKKPKTGDLVDLMVAKRADIRRSLPKPPEPPSPVLSVTVEERRAQAETILKSFGYRHAD